MIFYEADEFRSKNQFSSKARLKMVVTVQLHGWLSVKFD